MKCAWLVLIKKRLPPKVYELTYQSDIKIGKQKKYRTIVVSVSVDVMGNTIRERCSIIEPVTKKIEQKDSFCGTISDLKVLEGEAATYELLFNKKPL